VSFEVLENLGEPCFKYLNLSIINFIKIVFYVLIVTSQRTNSFVKLLR
jgi:hypothetical protein